MSAGMTWAGMAWVDTLCIFIKPAFHISRPKWNEPPCHLTDEVFVFFFCESVEKVVRKKETSPFPQYFEKKKRFIHQGCSVKC